MSTALIHRAFLPNQSDVQDAPDEFLNDLYSNRSRNMELVNQLIQGRLGLVKYSTTQLNGWVLGIANFDKYNGDKFSIILTSTDIYSIDFINSRFDILTPIYNTGTIEIQVGTKDIVRGNGTLWDSNLRAGDRIKIGAGSIHTGSTWYTIQSVDSDTQLTLTTNAVTTVAGTAYVAIVTYEMDEEDRWSWCTFQDAILGETFIATNFTATPVRWTGTGQMVALSGLPDSMKARYVIPYKDRLIFVNTNEGGFNQPQRARWSAVANCESYSTSSFKDFVDEATGLSGVVNFGEYNIIFKEDCIYPGRFIDGDDVFDWERAPFGEGCRSHLSLVSRKEGVYYYGGDKKFHRWNLQRDEILSETYSPETKDFDPNKDAFIYGADFARKNQVRWFCPTAGAAYNDYVFVYDYQQNVGKVWKYEQAQALSAIGKYVEQTDLFVDDAIWGEYYVDEQEGYWDDQQFLSNAPVFIYGGFDGYLRKCDLGIQDDGVDYTRSLELKRFNFDLPENFKRLWRQQFWLEAQTGGNLTVKLRINDETGYNVVTKTIDMTETAKSIIKKNITWDKRGQNFQPLMESTSHFALLGIITSYFKKRRTN